MSTKAQTQTQTFKDSITTALYNANLNVSKISFVRRPACLSNPYFNRQADGTNEVVINLANKNLDVADAIQRLVNLKQLEDRMHARLGSTR